MSRKTKSMQAVDRHVGQKIKWYRLQRNLSQDDLATALGISYQQLHKYENGSNSASASRLSDIARILRVQVGDFFRDFGAMQDNEWVNLQANREQLLLARYFNQIHSPEKRHAICHLLRMLSNSPAT